MGIDKSDTLVYKIILGIAGFLLIAVFTYLANSVQTQAKMIQDNRICITRLEAQYETIKDMLKQILENQKNGK